MHKEKNGLLGRFEFKIESKTTITKIKEKNNERRA